jgi:hypothetical protein
VPALIADAGDPAAWGYVEFFTANIRNPNTRRAYARACNQFFAWCEDRGLTLTAVRCRHIYRGAPADPFGPGREAAARGGAHAVRLAHHRPGGAGQPGIGRARPEACGEDRQDAVLDAAEWRKLLDAIPTGTVRDLRDRALIATLTYSFARINAA